MGFNTCISKQSKLGVVVESYIYFAFPNSTWKVFYVSEALRWLLKLRVQIILILIFIFIYFFLSRLVSMENPTDTHQNETLEDISHYQARGFLAFGYFTVVWICSINSAWSNVVHI